MDVLKREVYHKKFGEGVIVEQVENMITVEFECGRKNFPYPDAFKSYLEFIEILVQEKVDKEIKESEYLKQREKEEKIEKIMIEIDCKKKVSTRQRVEYYKPNVAFKCTYCDGGRSATCVGFNGVCSDKLINYNINVEKRVWCSQEECACKQYLNGEIKRWELEEEFEEIGVCSESAIMRDWAAYAGRYHNGDRAGEPIKMKNAETNSLCILTTREPNTPENMRFIFGVFMIDDTYAGDDYESGEVRAHPKYRLVLTPKEAKRMLYWKYHKNDSNPEKAMWGSGLFRYLTDAEAMQILCDIVKLKKGTKDEKLAKEFLEAYSNHTGLTMERIGNPSGALTL